MSPPAVPRAFGSMPSPASPRRTYTIYDSKPEYYDEHSPVTIARDMCRRLHIPEPEYEITAVQGRSGMYEGVVKFSDNIHNSSLDFGSLLLDPTFGVIKFVYTYRATEERLAEQVIAALTTLESEATEGAFL